MPIILFAEPAVYDLVDKECYFQTDCRNLQTANRIPERNTSNEKASNEKEAAAFLQKQPPADGGLRVGIGR